MKQLFLIALIGSVGLLVAADRGKDIVPRHTGQPVLSAGTRPSWKGCLGQIGHGGATKTPGEVSLGERVTNFW